MYNKLLEKIIFPLADLILDVNYIKVLNEWKELENSTPEQILKLQEERINYLINYTRNNVPFYKSFLKLEKLSDFPITSKELYKSDEDLFISDHYSKNKLIIEKSSGSSGVQGKVYMTKKEAFNSMAHQTYLWSWAGYRIGMPIFQLGMSTNRSGLKKIKDILFRSTYKQAFNLDPNDVVKNLNFLLKNKKGYFFGGYASGLFEYAKIANREELVDLKFKAIISWGDKMFYHYRELLENQFGCKVFDNYGTTEGFQIAGECEHHNLHILSPHVFVEILDENGREVKPNCWGHVVVTRLDSFSMPLIRYRLGDLAMKAELNAKCKCGRPFPMLKKVIGRDTDVIKTPSGNTLIVHFFTGILEHISEIEQFQVIQNEELTFELNYIKNESFLDFERVLKNLHDIFEKKAGEKLNVKYNEVSQIFNSPSGKPQIIVSRLKKVNL
jgi:phenylacetate-CoA ligase